MGSGLNHGVHPLFKFQSRGAFPITENQPGSRNNGYLMNYLINLPVTRLVKALPHSAQYELIDWHLTALKPVTLISWIAEFGF